MKNDVRKREKNKRSKKFTSVFHFRSFSDDVLSNVKRLLAGTASLKPFSSQYLTILTELFSFEKRTREQLTKQNEPKHNLVLCCKTSRNHFRSKGGNGKGDEM